MVHHRVLERPYDRRFMPLVLNKLRRAVAGGLVVLDTELRRLRTHRGLPAARTL
jgi:hypothetical protein